MPVVGNRFLQVHMFLKIYLKGYFLSFKYFIQLCFICLPSDSTVSENMGIDPRTVAISPFGDQQMLQPHNTKQKYSYENTVVSTIVCGCSRKPCR
jgi:hypothetical protein